MEYVSGGQGLWSTLDDYLVFARMFLGAGAVDGVRLLKAETLRLMTSNQLTEGQRARAGRVLDAGHGFGMGIAMVIDPAKARSRPCGGGAGAVGWPGGFGGWWRADPTDNSVLIFLAHNMVELEQLTKGIGLGVFSAIRQFQSLAAAV
jgi:CubicO group peptidase (beta-lactamase class C family)